MYWLFTLLAFISLAACKSKLEVGGLTSEVETGRSGKEKADGADDDGAAKLAADDCVDPDLERVASDQTFMLCDGTTASGEMSTCASDGGTDCVASAAYPAVAGSSLQAGNIALDVQIGGVTGIKRDTKHCVNGVDTTIFDLSELNNLPIARLAAQVTVNPTNTINLGNSHGLVTGSPIRVATTNTLPAGLALVTTYYAIITSATVIKFAASSADATAGTAVSLTTQGAGTHTVYSAPNSVVDLWDTIDDYNNNAAGTPSLSPWNTETLCDDNSFTNSLGGVANRTPSNTTPSGATAAWSEIWQDRLTGLYFTNQLYDGSGAVTWSGAMTMCAGLDSGDGTGTWRLPTQKEAMQLYINGIAKLAIAGGIGTIINWTSTHASGFQYYAWGVNLSNGNTAGDNHYAADHAILCVRD